MCPPKSDVIVMALPHHNAPELALPRMGYWLYRGSEPGSGTRCRSRFFSRFWGGRVADGIEIAAIAPS